jgi:hypothetical protein
LLVQLLGSDAGQQKTIETCTSLPLAAAATVTTRLQPKLVTSACADVISTTTSVEGLQLIEQQVRNDAASTSASIIPHPPPPRSAAEMPLPGLLSRRWTHSKQPEQKLTSTTATGIGTAASVADVTTTSVPRVTAASVQASTQQVHANSRSVQNASTPALLPVQVSAHSVQLNSQSPVHVHSSPAPVQVHANRQHNLSASPSLVSKQTTSQDMTASLSSQIPLLLKTASLVPESRLPSTSLQSSTSYVKHHADSSSNTASASYPTLQQLGAAIAASASANPPAPTSAAARLLVHSSKSNEDADNSWSNPRQDAAREARPHLDVNVRVTNTTITPTSHGGSGSSRAGRPLRPPARAGFRGHSSACIRPPSAGFVSSSAAAAASWDVGEGAEESVLTAVASVPDEDKVTTASRWAESAATPIIRRPISNSKVAIVRPSAIRLPDNRGDSTGASRDIQYSDNKKQDEASETVTLNLDKPIGSTLKGRPKTVSWQIGYVG